MPWRVIVLLTVVLAVAIWLGRGDPPGPTGPGPVRGPLPGKATFVGSETCRTCHEDRHATWLATGHAYSLRASDEGSVEGRFDGKTIETSTFAATPYRRDDGGYYMRIDPRDGRPAGDYRVTRVVGRTFEQAYLFTDPRGAWRILPLSWSIEHKRWDLTHEVLNQIAGHGEVVTASFDTRTKIFNDGCGQCHATDYDAGHDLDAGVYASRMLEGAVACESCHGPGSIHVAWHVQQREGEDYAATGRLLHPKRDLDAKGTLDSCGRCHYLHDWRYAIDDDPRVGYHDIAISQNTRSAGGFFVDGRLSGQRYHGTTQSQSPCFLKGEMSCLHCHSLHSGFARAMRWEDAATDAQCAQCHQAEADQGKAHTFHDDVRCVDCHMPRLVEGVLHFMRDHRIRSPEPELTVSYGQDRSPNACNACHKERTAGWALEWKEKWWGPAPRRLVEDTGVVADIDENEEGVTTERLAALLARTESERFFRMTALDSLGARRGDPAALDAVRAALEFRDPELLQHACLVFSQHADPVAAPALHRLLKSPVRTVRVEAAFALARAGWRHETHPAPEGLWADAEAMLVRQTRFTYVLVRLATIADALGRDQDADRYTRMLIQRLPVGTWSRAGVEVLHRLARRATERGRHVVAADTYRQVRQFYEQLEVQDDYPILFVDASDSFYGAGEREEAARNWRFAARRFDKGPVHEISRARGLALEGRVDDALAALERYGAGLKRDVAGGESWRRVRYAMNDIAAMGE